MNELLKYKNEYDRLNEKCNLSGEEALEEVIKDGYVLRYVTEQTPEICLAAVKQNGYALKYVREQTPELCLAAVKQDGYSLKYVREQTPELCLAAVKQNCDALQFVNSKLFEDTEIPCYRQVCNCPYRKCY